MKLKDAPTKAILAEIAKFQRAQKRYSVTSQIHADIGKQLNPLFAEMARRQACPRATKFCKRKLQVQVVLLVRSACASLHLTV